MPFTNQAAPAAFNNLIPQDQERILTGTSISITEEEFLHAKKFLSLVFLTDGQNILKPKTQKYLSQKDIYLDQGILPNNINSGSFPYENSAELDDSISEVSKYITDENVGKFYARLIEKRPLAFVGPDDHSVLRNRQELHGCPGNFNPEEYVLYSEMEFGAMLQVSGPTIFINDGNRNNHGEASKGNHETHGRISGITGARFEIDNGMEALHCINGNLEKAKSYHQETSRIYGNVLGDFGRIIGVNKQFVDGYQSIWGDFYEKNQGSPQVSRSNLITPVLEKRLHISYKKLFADALANSDTNNKAYIRIVGIGDGAWAKGREEEIQYAIGKSVRRVFDELRPDQKQKISAIEFSQYTKSSAQNNHVYLDGFNNLDKITQTNTPKLSVQLNDVAILSSSSTNPPFAHKIDSKYKGSQLCVNFAWDSGSFVGNEYWMGPNMLSASGDPAAACATSIVKSFNPVENKKFIKRLNIVDVNYDLRKLHQLTETKDYPQDGKVYSDHKSMITGNVCSGNMMTQRTSFNNDLPYPDNTETDIEYLQRLTRLADHYGKIYKEHHTAVFMFSEAPKLHPDNPAKNRFYDHFVKELKRNIPGMKVAAQRNTGNKNSGTMIVSTPKANTNSIQDVTQEIDSDIELANENEFCAARIGGQTYVSLHADYKNSTNNRTSDDIKALASKGYIIGADLNNYDTQVPSGLEIANSGCYANTFISKSKYNTSDCLIVPQQAAKKVYGPQMELEEKGGPKTYLSQSQVNPSQIEFSPEVDLNHDKKLFVLNFNSISDEAYNFTKEIRKLGITDRYGGALKPSVDEENGLLTVHLGVEHWSKISKHCLACKKTNRDFLSVDKLRDLSKLYKESNTKSKQDPLPQSQASIAAQKPSSPESKDGGVEELFNPKITMGGTGKVLKFTFKNQKQALNFSKVLSDSYKINSGHGMPYLPTGDGAANSSPKNTIRIGIDKCGELLNFALANQGFLSKESISMLVENNYQPTPALANSASQVTIQGKSKQSGKIHQRYRPGNSPRDPKKDKISGYGCGPTGCEIS